MAQWDWQHFGSSEMQVRFPAWQGGLRIWRCCHCSLGHNYSLDLIPGLETPYTAGWQKKKKKKLKNLWKRKLVRWKTHQDTSLKLNALNHSRREERSFSFPYVSKLSHYKDRGEARIGERILYWNPTGSLWLTGIISAPREARKSLVPRPQTFQPVLTKGTFE